MKQKKRSQEEIAKQAQKLLEERGRKALELARKEILQEKIESKEAFEALKLFMSYFEDLARPTLMSIVCEAAGGDPDITIPVAASMVLINGGIDIHDDIIDQSETKLSHPTVLGKFGEDIALLAGDALLFKGFTLLFDSVKQGVPSEKISSILKILNRMFFELGDAEALELRFRGRTDVSPKEYLSLARKKAADVEALARISAILSGGSEETIEKLGNYGRLLGLILILRDDILDATDFAEASHRIERECLPLPIFYALQSKATKSTLVSLIHKRSLTKRDVEVVQENTVKSGGIERSKKIINNLAKEAYSVIRQIDKGKTLQTFVMASCIPYLEEEAT
jgi:geranylgeranyl diphosphate synthase type I